MGNYRGKVLSRAFNLVGKVTRNDWLFLTCHRRWLLCLAVASLLKPLINRAKITLRQLTMLSKLTRGGGGRISEGLSNNTAAEYF